MNLTLMERLKKGRQQLFLMYLNLISFLLKLQADLVGVAWSRSIEIYRPTVALKQLFFQSYPGPGKGLCTRFWQS